MEDGLDRERMLDMGRRIAAVRGWAIVVLGAALVACGPWLGWWPLAPLTVAALLFPAADLLAKRMRRPELGLFAAWATAEAVIAVSVALSGGPEVPILSWLAIPVVTLVSRFSIRGVVAGVVTVLGLLTAVAFAVDAQGVLDDPPLLIAPAALIVAVAMFSTALMRSDLEYRSRSVIDPLTGMLNRAALAARAAELRQQSAVSGDPVSLILADVDEFKALNDEHGHSTGDAVLREVAHRLRKRMRTFELAYRIGGEEFVLLLPGAEPAEAVALADQLCASVADAWPGGLRVTLSCGVAGSATGTRFRYEEVFAAADAALYEAKRSGRNCVRAAPAVPVRRAGAPLPRR